MIKRVEELEAAHAREKRDAEVADRADHIEAGGSEHGTAGERIKRVAVGMILPPVGVYKAIQDGKLAEEAKDLVTIRRGLREAGIGGGEDVGEDGHGAPSGGKPRSRGEGHERE